MAKAVKTLSSVDDIFKELSQINPFGMSNFAEKEDVENSAFIDSGNWILNATLSGSIKKGIPATKIVSIAGDSGCLPYEEKVKVYKMQTKTIKYDSEDTELFRHEISPKS